MRRGYRINYCEKEKKLRSGRRRRISECAKSKNDIILKVHRISSLKQELYVRNITRDEYKIQVVSLEDVDEMDDLLAESENEDDIEILSGDQAQYMEIEDSDEDEGSNNARNNYLGSTHAVVDKPFSLQYAFYIDVSLYCNHLIDFDCIDLFTIWQANNDRQYLFANIRLRLAVVDKLKQWNKNRPTLHHDDKFVKVLLIDIFGVAILEKSSFSALDSDKIKFIRGTFSTSASNSILKICLIKTYEFY